jgi:predicted RNA-binding protein with PIN domain
VNQPLRLSETPVDEGSVSDGVPAQDAEQDVEPAQEPAQEPAREPAQEPVEGGVAGVDDVAAGSPGPAETLAGPLPESVRGRVVALTADALGRLAVEHLPASLRRVASFTPSRRARLAASQIAGVLETDEDFRGHVATQVRAARSELAAAVESGSLPAAADPVEVAAVAYLLRSPGWTTLVADVVEAVAAEREAVVGRQAVDQVERLRRQLAEAQSQLVEIRSRMRDQVETLKADNAELRRKLGLARTQTAEAAADREQARAALEAATTAAATAAGAAEAEARRLRARVADLESDLSGARRAERVTRDIETLRARLLLDTLLDAAQGLRRELALPAVEGAPADAVAAHLAEPGERTSTGHGSLAADDPGMLDQLLALPRAHLVVDGYNVTKATWPELSLERQRDRLLSGLGPLAARSGAEITVVFDAHETKARPLVTAPRGVRVWFSPYGVIADDVIRDLAAAEPAGRPVVVVTGDQAIVRDVTAAGHRAAAAAALARLLARAR